MITEAVECKVPFGANYIFQVGEDVAYSRDGQVARGVVSKVVITVEPIGNSNCPYPKVKYAIEGARQLISEQYVAETLDQAWKQRGTPGCDQDDE